jgi:DNA-binding transcriptional LysR family regulator
LATRSPGAFEVTPAGALLYDEAVEIFSIVARLGILVRDMDEEISGHVTLALASHVVSPVLDEVLALFHETHPKATIGIEVLGSGDVIQAVRQSQASFGICLVHEKHAQLDYLRLFREYFGFFCGPRHHLFGRTGLTIANLRGESSVSFNTDRLTDALRSVALLRASAELDEQVIGVSPSLEEVRRMIVAGLGIGPLPVHVARHDVETGHLWQLPPYDALPAIDIYVVSNPNTRMNRAEQSMLAMLKRRIDAIPFEERDYR